MDSILVRYEADIKKLKADLKTLEDDIRGPQEEATKAGKQIEKSFDSAGKSVNNFSLTIDRAAKALGAMVAIDTIIALGKSIVETTAKFQKFEAILTNTLGSNSAAKQALKFIQEFAAETPFQIDELTDAFIKLANRGVIATKTQMTAIGDVATSLGKDFNQVVEAIADVNNTERWNEIGIKAQTVGNKVSLSFKGTTVEVDKTVKGVTEAVEQLGKLNGVAGTSAAVTGTLGGQLSGLEDTITDLKNTIGQFLAPAISAVINGIKEFVGSSKELKVLGFVFSSIFAPVKALYDVLKTAYDTAILPIVNVLKATFLPVLEALNKAFGGSGESVSDFIAKFNPLILTIRVALIPLQLLAKGLSLLTPIIENYVVPAFQSFVVLLAETKNNIADFINAITQSGFTKKIQDTFGFEIGKVGKTNIEDLKKSFVKNSKDMINATNELDKARELADKKAMASGKQLTEYEKVLADERVKIKKKELEDKALSQLKWEKLQKEGTPDLLDFQTKSEAFLTKATDKGAKKRHEIRVEEMHKFKKEVTDPAIKAGQQSTEDVTAKELKEIEKRSQAQALAADTVNQASDLLTDALQEKQQQRTDAEIQRVQEQTAIELALLQSKYDNGLISEEIFNRKKEALLKKQKEKEAAIKTKDAQNDKKIALFRILVDTATAIVKAVASFPATAGQPFASIAAGIGALQFGLVAAQPIPKFKRGVVGFRGRGTDTSDSNLVAISNNESVINAASTRKYKKELEAINKGDFDIDSYFASMSNVRNGIKSVEKQNAASRMNEMVTLMKSVQVNNESSNDDLIRVIRKNNSFDLKDNTINKLAKKLNSNNTGTGLNF